MIYTFSLLDRNKVKLRIEIAIIDTDILSSTMNRRIKNRMTAPLQPIFSNLSFLLVSFFSSSTLSPWLSPFSYRSNLLISANSSISLIIPIMDLSLLCISVSIYLILSSFHSRVPSTDFSYDGRRFLQNVGYRVTHRNKTPFRNNPLTRWKMGTQDKGGITVNHTCNQDMVYRSEVLHIVEGEPISNSRILTLNLSSGNPHVHSYVCMG